MSIFELNETLIGDMNPKRIRTVINAFQLILPYET